MSTDQIQTGRRPVFMDDPPEPTPARHDGASRALPFGAFEVIGFVVVVAGVALLSIPAAMIVAGVAVALFCEVLEWKAR